MAGVIAAGNIVVDILARPIDEIRWDATIWIDELAESLGGNGANTSFTLGMMGCPVRLLGAVGRDSFGDYALNRLSFAVVDISRVARVDVPTSATSVLVRADGARALLHRPGASREALPEPIEFTPELIQDMSRFHMANVFGLPKQRAQAGETLRRAREAGLATSLDTGHDALGQWMSVIGPCLPHLDVLFVNRDEARALSGSDDPTRAAEFFLERGVGVVVLKLGVEGCRVYQSGVCLAQPAYDVPVVDTTGAGDCFAGAFLAALVRGAPFEEAARYGNAAGALNIQALGGTTGVRTLAETRDWMQTARQRG